DSISRNCFTKSMVFRIKYDTNGDGRKVHFSIKRTNKGYKIRNVLTTNRPTVERFLAENYLLYPVGQRLYSFLYQLEFRFVAKVELFSATPNEFKINKWWAKLP